MTKTYCDGCGMEIKGFDIKGRYSIEIKGRAPSNEHASLHACSRTCMSKAVREVRL